MILVPLGLFFTYQANKDSGILKNDAIKSFFKKIFMISEARQITLKEIIIDTPDYEKCYNNLKEIYSISRIYKTKNRLKRLPSIKTVFFNEKDDVLQTLNGKLEKTVEELSNSENRKIIIYLNEIPVLNVKAVSSPFKKRWMNIILLPVLPISLLVYARSIRGRIKLMIELTNVETKTREIINIIKREKLINIDK